MTKLAQKSRKVKKVKSIAKDEQKPSPSLPAKRQTKKTAPTKNAVAPISSKDLLIDGAKAQVVGDARTPLISDDNDLISISATLGRLPKDAKDGYHKFALAHPLHSLATSTVCVVVADHLTAEETIKYKAEVDRSARHHQMLFAQYGVEGVDLVISNTQLKREYNTFESLAALAQAYDVFVVDRRVHAQVIKFMGAPFRKKAKYPQLADLSDPSTMATTIGDAINRVTLKIGKFSPIVSCKFGRATWTEAALMENALIVIGKLGEFVHGGWSNIKKLAISHRKFPHLHLVTQSVTSVAPSSKASRVPSAATLAAELTCSEEATTVRVTKEGVVKLTRAVGKGDRRVAVATFVDEEKSQQRNRRRTTEAIQRRSMAAHRGDNERKRSASAATEKKAKKIRVDEAITDGKKVKVVKKIRMVTADGEAKKAANKVAKKKTKKTK